MTFELNIRTLDAQTACLQRDVQALVQTTSEDKEFRRQHEERLSKLWQEILVVKQHMNKVENVQGDARVGYEKCQQETAAVLDEFRGEIQDFKGVLDGLSKQMNELPTMQDALDESGYNSLTSDRHQSMEMAQTQRLDTDHPQETIGE